MPKKEKPTPHPRRVLVTFPELFRLARRQVNETPGGRLGWLVKFAREDPSNWLPGEENAHRYRLSACMFPGHRSDPPVVETPSNPRICRPSDLIKLHGELRQKLLELVTSKAAVDMPAEGLQTTLTRWGKPGEKPAVFDLTRDGPLRTILFQTLARLVSETDRLPCSS